MDRFEFGAGERGHDGRIPESPTACGSNSGVGRPLVPAIRKEKRNSLAVSASRVDAAPIAVHPLPVVMLSQFA